MPLSTERRFKTLQSVAFDTVLADSQVIPFGHASGGEVRIPAGSSITSITWWSCDTDTGTFLACYDSANAAVTQTVAASRAHSLPASLIGRGFLKGVTNADGVADVVTRT